MCVCRFHGTLSFRRSYNINEHDSKSSRLLSRKSETHSYFPLRHTNAKTSHFGTSPRKPYSYDDRSSHMTNVAFHISTRTLFGIFPRSDALDKSEKARKLHTVASSLSELYWNAALLFGKLTKLPSTLPPLTRQQPRSSASPRLLHHNLLAPFSRMTEESSQRAHLSMSLFTLHSIVLLENVSKLFSR